jgi:hypothetical protein
MLTVLQVHSQNTSQGKSNRVTTYINQDGDTMVVMSINDAKIILEDVLKYEYTDSLLSVYKEKDSLQTNTINIQKEVLMNMGKEKINLEGIISNLEGVIENKEGELLLKDDIIKQQKKEIRKQKFLKTLGFSGSIILPILVLLAIL